MIPRQLLTRKKIRRIQYQLNLNLFNERMKLLTVFRELAASRKRLVMTLNEVLIKGQNESKSKIDYP